MPPTRTFTATTTATSTPPDHTGAPVTVRSTSPADWNCGSRYSQLISTTRTLATRRTAIDSSRASAKSGSV